MALTECTVHPLVLLSVVDHYNRLAKNTRKRVVGVLLGEVSQGVVDVRNSFAVPFEEDLKADGVFFLDHLFLEQMFAMFKKVNASEKIIGWYHSGPKLRESDLRINSIFKKYVKDPLLVIVDVQPGDGLPVESFFAVDEIKEDGSESTTTFQHIPSRIEALEAEEVGVEHLLRDIKDTTVSDLTTEVDAKLNSLKTLVERLKIMKTYLENVLEKRLPPNQAIIAQMQDVFNLLPNLQDPEMIKAFAVKTNDQMVVVYLASLIRAVIALHNLLNNKLQNKALEAKSVADEKTAEEDAKKAAEDKAAAAKDKANSADEKEKKDGMGA